ncbi:hypothetical protein L8C07_05420 [Paenibacillus sp. CMAA1739]|uniref:hypothetical protein n=1 Tax=Paenibacillus ottowii TaxID=2315729 RepID=UPI002DBC79A6|nr:hypothetical protein [Paenibacillus sp. CMAA1739]MEC4565377.1 hypothetical protein [Paenibacillus sp. CMAA1739]
MKTIKVFNSESKTINIVLNFSEDIVIKPQSFALIETNEKFNTDNFYVEGEEDWSVKYNTENGDLELYLPKASWQDDSYKMYGKKMQTA